jgi:hypothetical protein
VLTSFAFWMAVGFLAGIVYASLFEWSLHRHVMHRPVRGFTYPFRAHAMVHHHVFRGDHTYHLMRDEDKWTIPMAWWNGPAIVLIGGIPFVVAGWWSGCWGLTAGGLLACALYFAAYEYLHWCMHLPRRRNIERSGIFFRLNGHHVLHHRYMHKNFNVVCPLADWILGTLLLRSKIAFPQPVGPSVPNVQPLTRRPASTSF